jgi:hypothetical protein
MNIILKNGYFIYELKRGSVIQVENSMQSGYSYTISAPYGAEFDPEFNPAFSPVDMLLAGVFEGKYLCDAILEYPADMIIPALNNGKMSPSAPDPSLNLFGIKSRQSLHTWRNKNWIFGNDPRGWFEWYCRYYIGRREPEIDQIQIKRWKSFRRHLGAVRKNCSPGDHNCRRKQKQALIQWAHPYE